MQTYSTQSANESGTMYYYKNILDARNFKGKVKISYKVYKMLDRTVFDAMCCVIFLQEVGVHKQKETVPLPNDFCEWSNDQKIEWLNNICSQMFKKWFFEDGDLFEELRRRILSNPDQEEKFPRWANFLR